MKTLITFILSTIIVFSSFAQGNYNTVSIKFNGNNRQVLIDGKLYTPMANNPNDASYNFTVVTNEIVPGTHSVQLVRNNNRRNTEVSFTLRNNYDIEISVGANNTVQIKESYRKLNSGTSAINRPMSASGYNMIVQEVRRRNTIADRMNVLNIAFTNAYNYFTTAQAGKLIQMISGETNRLQLAKSAIRGITDTRNVYSLNSLFASQQSRNELSDYIRQYSNGQTGIPVTPGNKVAMADNNFGAIINNIRNQTQENVKLNIVSNAFATSYNYFSTDQVVQVLQLLSSEYDRLQMAKASYKTIVDPISFSKVYNLFASQSSKEELAYYVRTNGGTPGSLPPAVATNIAMSEADFISLRENIKAQWLPGAKMSELTNTFANTRNYFTSYQVSQLVQMVSDDANRMQLAKVSFRTITDPENIALLYNAFVSQADRDALTAYYNSFKSGSATSPSNSYRTPMSDSNFSTLLESDKKLWIPGTKKAAVMQTFNSAGNYFTTSQAIQLIQLVNDERDRLEMAKSSYKTITDTENFSQVYSLFNNQSYKNDLANYVNAIH